MLAAANPAYGRYNIAASPQENINLPAALLSRFDLMWLILDVAGSESDVALAQHVLHVHREGKPPVVCYEDAHHPIRPHSACFQGLGFGQSQHRSYVHMLPARAFSPCPGRLSNYAWRAEIRQDEIDAGEKAMVRSLKVRILEDTLKVFVMTLGAIQLPASVIYFAFV